MSFRKYAISILNLIIISHVSLARAQSDHPIEVSGFLDLYYSYNFNSPKLTSNSSPGLPDATNGYRIFDRYHDDMSLALASLSFKKNVGSIFAQIDLGFGENVDVLSPYDEVSKHVIQAFVEYTPEAVSNFKISLGKMYTHLGWEVTRSIDNWAYSRPFLFGYSLPYWHNGVAAQGLFLNEKLKAAIYLYNENSGLYETGDGKSYGAQLRYGDTDKLAVTYNFFSGKELDSLDVSHTRTLHELIPIFILNSNWQFAADIVYGQLSNMFADSTSSWFAFNVAAKWSLETFYISPRFEYYNDRNGSSIKMATDTTPSVPQIIKSYTLTSGWDMNYGFSTRLEARYDHSSTRLFSVNEDIYKNSQLTFTGAILYAF